jgi:hypothetical protein
MKSKTKTKPEKKPKVNKAAEWGGMPEFNNPGLKPVKTLIVNFESNEDMLKFSKMVGQQITAKTRSIWYPVKPEECAIDKRWTSKKK